MITEKRMFYPSHGELPKDCRDVFVAYQGEAYTGYFSIANRSAPELGGIFHLTSRHGRVADAHSDYVDYWMYVEEV